MGLAQVFGDDDIQRLADSILGREPENNFSPVVPQLDAPFRVGKNKGISGLLDYGLIKVHRDYETFANEKSALVIRRGMQFELILQVP